MKKRYKVIIGAIIVAALVSPHVEYSFDSSIETVESDQEQALIHDHGEHDESDHVYETDNESGNVTYHIKVQAAIKEKEEAEEAEEKIKSPQSSS